MSIANPFVAVRGFLQLDHEQIWTFGTSSMNDQIGADENEIILISVACALKGQMNSFWSVASHPVVLGIDVPI